MSIGRLIGRARGLYARLRGRDTRFRLRREYIARHGTPEVTEGDGVRLVRYDRAGPDAYATYRAIQQSGNIDKIDAVFALEKNLAHLAHYAGREAGPISLVLCHGTRNGAEQRWFKQHLGGRPTIIGTEISDTATRFPDTIQWDFHESRPEWIGKADIVYSNSWDHSIDPDKMFANWMKCLSPSGVLLIEHTIHHRGEHADPLDPFGATREGLVRLLDRIGSGAYRVTGIITDLPVTADERCVIVVRRA